MIRHSLIREMKKQIFKGVIKKILFGWIKKEKEVDQMGEEEVKQPEVAAEGAEVAPTVEESNIEGVQPVEEAKV